MDPDMYLRQRCIDMASRANPATPAALFEAAAAIERFIRTGDHRLHPPEQAAD